MSLKGDLYLAQDLNDKGAKHYNALPIKEVRSLLDEDLNLYEIIKEDRPHKVYMDFDCKYNYLDAELRKLDDDQIKKEIVSIIIGMCEEFVEEYHLGDYWNYNVLDASNKLKFSFHFAFDVKVKNFEESQILHKKLLSFFEEHYGDDEDYHNIHKFIDKCVYTKNRLIRLPNQSKFGQDRPLKIYYGSSDIKDHLITYFNKDIPSIELPSRWITAYQKKEKKNFKIFEKLKIKDYSTDDELQWLVKNTLHKTEQYDDWIKWVWSCLGAGIHPDIIHEYSYNGCPEKYSEEATNKVIEQFIDGKSQLGFNTLKKWAKENGKDLDREVEKVAKELPKLKKDHITWLDLLKKYHDKYLGCDFEDTIRIIRDDVSQVISHIQGGQDIFTIYANDDEPFALRTPKKAPYLNIKYHFFNSKNEKVIDSISLVKMMFLHPLEFPLYNKLVFKPDDHNLRKNERNTFSGFQAEERGCIDMDLVEPILYHIKHILSNNNEEYYRYMMTWFAQIIKTPWKPTDIFLLLSGNQGAGKTSVADFLIKYVFGKNLSLSTSGISSMTSRFNGAVKSKLFVCCNELTTIDASKNSFNSAFDKMKNLITDRMIQIELKGLEHIQIDNFCNFLGTTNHDFTAKIEKGDRRYACFRVSDERVGDYDYFDKLHSCFTQEGGDAFYSYMKNYPDEEMVNLRKIPLTDIRNNMMDSSKNNVENFIEDMFDDLIDIDDDMWINKDEKIIEINGLYSIYLNWILSQGESQKYSTKRFSRMIPKEKIKERGRCQFRKKQVRFIQFR